MDKRIRHISKEIEVGRLLEQNIPQLLNYMAEDYQIMAEVRLAMHYFTFYEAYYDDENTWSQDIQTVISKINDIISNFILKSQSGDGREEAIRQIDNIRKDIMKRMGALTAYTDLFQNYEYVLNRLEYRFKEGIKEIDDDTEFSKEILRYIFDSEDNFVINEKIKEILGQLPIRMTKQKYFDILKESLNAYLGNDTEALDTYLYMLKTSAMLYQEEEMETFYPRLWEKKEHLSHLDYKDITKENYEKALNMLHAATLTLETETSVYISLQEIINEIYVILLCIPYSGMVDCIDRKTTEAAISIIGDINKAFLEKEKVELPSELTQKFVDLEGVQEELSIDIDVMENALYDIGHNHNNMVQSLMLSQFMQVIVCAQKLLSNSLFIDLEIKAAADLVVDEDRIKKEMDALEKELQNLFSSHDKMIGRAVMANTLNKMPVFFTSHKEVMDYVIYSLERCADRYEKVACYEIINGIMSE